jgi:MoaA/NifB/PqqE/SkfB family radical SAM enzyme
MRAAVPKHVFLELQMTCNLRCVQCDIYKLSNPPDELSLDERTQLVRDIAEWRPSIRLVLAGGELFMRRTMLYGVAAEAKRVGIYATLNTNGTLLRPEDIERLPSSGIRCVVVSIDSDEEHVHDEIRGVAGTFARAANAVRELVAARDRSHEDFSVLVSAILGRHNLHRAQAMVRFFEGLGVDTMLFQPLQPAFARAVGSRWWERDPLFPLDEHVVRDGIDTLIALRRAGHRVFQSEQQLEDIRRYFERPDELHREQCASMEQHMMVDMRGDVRLCFNMERIGLRPIGNVRTSSLRTLWEDRATELTRAKMLGCGEGCGSMLCHAR